MDLSGVPRKSEQATARRIDDLFYVIDTDTSELHSMNDVGARIYELIDGKRSISDITAVIVNEYEVESASAEADVVAFLTSLEEKRLIGL